jgi:hypothetical protein
MDLTDVKMYRMTHIQNVSRILSHGIVHRGSPNADPAYVPLGDAGLIRTRATKNVVVDNGDVSAGGEMITLGNFIPFHFGVRMPMLYVIQGGGNFVEKPTPPEDIIYVSCRIVDVIGAKSLFYFCDGHALDRFTTFYDQNKIADLPNLIDWAAIKSQYWGGRDNLELKRKKQAEFLIASDVSPECLSDFGCYSVAAKNSLVALGISDQRIKIVPYAYF